MITRVQNAFNHFLTKFSYHQRFWFFWGIFAFGVPIPVYLLITMQSYLVKNIDLEVIGTEYQYTLGSLVNNLAEHEIISYVARTSPANYRLELSRLQERIGLDFHKLYSMHRLHEDREIPYLGDGFSHSREEGFDIESWFSQWEQIKQATQKNAPLESLVHAQQRLMKDMLLELGNIGYNYGIFLDARPEIHYLAHATLEDIPKTQVYLPQLFVLREQIKKTESTADKVAYLATSEKLEDALEATLNTLNQVYQNNTNDLSHHTELLSQAKAALTDYHYSLRKLLQNAQSIASTQPGNPERLTLKVLRASEKLRRVGLAQLNVLLTTKKSQLVFQQEVTIVFATVCTLILTVFGVCRTFSRHLIKILNHIKELAAGRFSLSAHLDPRDEFGQLGLAINHMVESVDEIVGKLQELGRRQTDSSAEIARTAEEQEENLAQQDTSIGQIEATGKEIAQNARELANIMNELSTASKQTHLTENVRQGMQRLEEKMNLLASRSAEIGEKLEVVHHKVENATWLIAFMTRVSEQAKMLALNASIESGSAIESGASFKDVTMEIGRFATKTASATQSIHKIIDEMEEGVNAVQRNASSSLDEINRGAQRLRTFSQQLSSITRQVERQGDKFASVNAVMQEQAQDAERIIGSIHALRQSARQNTPAVKQLHEVNAELGDTAEKLQSTLNMFFHCAQEREMSGSLADHGH